ncbi:MAG: hypothetical protein C4294_01875, partial [Nitrospiraceae bacterium]
MLRVIAGVKPLLIVPRTEPGCDPACTLKETTWTEKFAPSVVEDPESRTPQRLQSEHRLRERPGEA